MIENTLQLWANDLPVPDANSHKYSRGQAVILASSDMTGATILAASACARMGAGIIRVIVANEDAKKYYQTLLPPPIIVTTDFDNVYFKHTKAILLGPGLSQGDELTARFFEHMPEDKNIILDGGALTYIAKNNHYNLLGNTIITPHEGEYSKLFNDQNVTDASDQYNCLIVKKGAQTIICDHKNKLANNHSSPWLASAGTGDVLAGMITGLVAQDMDKMQAAAAAVWMHGEAGKQIGCGLVASDIEKILPQIYKNLLTTR